MKQIRTLLTATLMLAGTALWSGCSSNELMDDNRTSGAGEPVEAESFSFKLSGTGAATRVAMDADELAALETSVNSLYVALFATDNTNAAQSKLHRIYRYDPKAVEAEGGAPDETWTDLGISKEGDNFKISRPGTVGDYIVYFIANPDAAIKTSLKEMQSSQDRIALSAFEAELYTTEGTADGRKNSSGGIVDAGSEADAIGFIMIGKEAINLGEYTTQEVTLTRLAARFDFINSAAATGQVKITKIELNQVGKKSILAAAATTTDAGSLGTLVFDDLGTSSWSAQTESYIAYAYENLEIAKPDNRCEINVYYTLTTSAGGGGGDETSANKKLVIELKDGDTYIGVTRNHLYRIYLNGVSGEFKLEVADWNEGATVTVPNGDLAIVYDPNNPQDNFLGKIGDYACVDASGNLYFVDGGLRGIAFNGTLTYDNASAPALSDEQKAQCVGVVFSNLVSKTDKALGFKGYVMAAKSYTTGLIMKEGLSIATFSGQQACANLGAAYNDLDGYTHCQEIGRLNAENLEENSPSLYKLTSGECALPELSGNTSGWFIPSTGQLFQMIVNLGEEQIRLRQYSNSADARFLNNGGYRTILSDLTSSNAAANAINNRLSKLGNGNYSSIIVTTSGTFMQSSSRGANKFSYLTFAHAGVGLGINCNHTAGELWPVFAYK